MSTELVPDPVSHISISGVHGGEELDERLASAPDYVVPRSGRRTTVGALLLGAVLGACVMYLVGPTRAR